LTSNTEEKTKKKERRLKTVSNHYKARARGERRWNGRIRKGLISGVCLSEGGILESKYAELHIKFPFRKKRKKKTIKTAGGKKKTDGGRGEKVGHRKRYISKTGYGAKGAIGNWVDQNQEA